MMHRELVIGSPAIDESALMRERKVGGAHGAVITFLGYVRIQEGDRAIVALEYECFERMARYQFELLFDQVEKRWPVSSLRLVHRIGIVKVNEASLWVELVAPHRGEAFSACQWLIDEMKRVVPIWKKAIYAG